MEAPQQFADHIADTIRHGEVRELLNGRTGYWKDGTLVIVDPKHADGGTAFRPPVGYEYFIERLR